MRKIILLLLMFSTINSYCQSSFNPQAVTITFNTTVTSSYILPPYVSGTINDPTDPAMINGVVVDVKENNVAIPSTDYTITITSSKTSVVPVANIVVTKNTGNVIIKITPTGVGYTDIKLTLTKGSSSANTTIKYAASAASSTPASTWWHTGYSDASAVIALDDNYMVMADDEKNYLYVVDRTHSGLPIKKFYYGDYLGLTDGSTGDYKEVDVEACVKSATTTNKVYWLGSMSNAGSSNVYKVNSNKLFATTITGTGATTSFTVGGYYSSMRQRLIVWGDANGYNFTASTASGHDAKSIDGFNMEGMTIAPDNTTLYIGLRAPLVPTANRTKAVIAPLLNFEAWFNNGSPSGNPVFGSPIELNLGGRGIRDLVKLSNGSYIIVAGNYDNTPINGAIYKWTGNASDAPIQLSTLNIAALNAEACLEVNESGQPAQNKLAIISDNGSFDFYNDGNEAKDLSHDEYKKYRSDIITAPTNVLPVKFETFTVKKQNNNAVLQWRYISNDASLFEIQRSFDNKNFSIVNVIKATSFELNYTDNNPIGDIVYYRIKALDINGNAYYSNTKKIHFNISNKVQIYPNPIVNNSFNITSLDMGIKSVIVLDSKGSQIKRFSFSTSSIKVNTSKWAKGIYTIIVRLPNGLATQEKLVVE